MLPILLLLVPPVDACPTIATGTPNQLSFDTAVVAIVRQDQRTTFTVAVNPSGDPQSFALVLPVPEVLAEDEIHVLDPGVFAHLDAYSAARHVADAGCPSESDADTDSDSDADTDWDTDTGVDVEAEYIVGEYQIVILSATESNALGAWLDANEYYLPDGAEPLLAEYIDAGSYFLAAKVIDGTSFTDGEPLSPLQLAYDSAAFSIPIRLATLNSPGEQDMVIYAVNDAADGRVGIANYPEFTVPDNCVWGTAGVDDFGAFYEDLYTEHWTAQGDAAWAAEFSGGPYSCNPCTGVYPSPSEVAALGFVGEYDAHFLTRLHFRYTPEQADQDPTFYLSGIRDAHSQSYADDNPWNDCVESWCDGRPYADGDADTDVDADADADADSDTDTDTDTDADADADAGCAGGCDTSGGPGLLGAALGLAFAARRRARRA